MSQANWEGWQKKYPTMDLQMEFFLLKFGQDEDIKRDEVTKLKVQFQSFAKQGQGELEEDEAMRFLDSMSKTKTFKELRQMVVDIDVDHNRKLSFLEWACAIYSKSWEKLHAQVIDHEVVKAAEREAEKKRQEQEIAIQKENEKRLHELQAKQEKAAKDQDAEAAGRAKAELEAELLRQEQETKRRHAEQAAERAKKEAEEAERRAHELKQQGIKGKVAIFKYAANDVKDATKLNEQRLKEDAAKRRLLKQQEIEAMAKKKLAEEEISKKKAEAEEARKKAEAAEKAAAEAARVKAQAEEEAKKAEEEKQKALEKSDQKMRDEYERKKKEEEDKQKLKKEEENKIRQAGRDKIAQRAAKWSNNSADQVMKDLDSDNKKNLSKATTNSTEKSGLTQASLFMQIRKGTNLEKTPGAKTASEELTDDQRAAFVADQMKKRSSISQ